MRRKRRPWGVWSPANQRLVLVALERAYAHEELPSRRRRWERMIRDLRRAIKQNAMQNVTEEGASA